MIQLLTNLSAWAGLKTLMKRCRFENCLAEATNDDKNSAMDETTKSDPVEDDEQGKLERFEKTVKEEPHDEPSQT